MRQNDIVHGILTQAFRNVVKLLICELDQTSSSDRALSSLCMDTRCCGCVCTRSWKNYCVCSVWFDCIIMHAKRAEIVTMLLSPFEGGEVAPPCLQGRSMDGVPASHNPVLQEVLDLRPYINSSAAAVHESFSLDRTYVVFRTLGLRHLVVVDRHNHVKGIVTRKVQASAFTCTAQLHKKMCVMMQAAVSANNLGLWSIVQTWSRQ